MRVDYTAQDTPVLSSEPGLATDTPRSRVVLLPAREGVTGQWGKKVSFLSFGG